MTHAATLRFSAALLLAMAGLATPAHALKTDLAQPAEEKAAEESAPRIPLDAMTSRPSIPQEADEPAEEPDGAAGPADQDQAGPAGEDTTPPPILTDPEKLPEPVRRMRRLIMEAARTGDLERLRPLLGTGDSATQISLADAPDDPIAFLHTLSGDPDGYEILAILLEVMEAPFVELSPGTDEAIYVWPYFVAMPLDKLTPAQMVELMTLVTAGDYAAMEEFGAYNFYRVGITPEGEWVFFVAGD